MRQHVPRTPGLTLAITHPPILIPVVLLSLNYKYQITPLSQIQPCLKLLPCKMMLPNKLFLPI